MFSTIIILIIDGKIFPYLKLDTDIKAGRQGWVSYSIS